MKIWKITLTFILSTFLLSCEDKKDPCGAVDPIPPTVTFTLVNSQSGKSLIGSDRLYHPDTINLLNDTPPFFIYNSTDTTVEYDFGQFKNGEQLSFRLNQTNTDSIRVNFEVVQGECHTVRSLREFYYNNKLISAENGLFVIEK